MTKKKSYLAPCMEQAVMETYAAIAATSDVNVGDYPDDIWGDETEW